MHKDSNTLVSWGLTIFSALGSQLQNLHKKQILKVH